MQISKVIYKLKSISKTLDVDGNEESVTALNIAVDILTAKIQEERLSASTSHKSLPVKGRTGNARLGLTGVLRSMSVNYTPHGD
jgi:hypothetical protein